MISRRSLFSFLAAAPLGAVAAVKAAAEPSLVPPAKLTARYHMGAYEAYQRYQEAVIEIGQKIVDPPLIPYRFEPVGGDLRAAMCWLKHRRP